MRIILILSLLFLSRTLFAQYTFSGIVTDEKNEALPGSQVVLYAQDSLYAASMTDKEGKFHFKNISEGIYELIIQMAGYTPIEEKREIRKNQHYTYSLVPEMNVALDDVEVVANRGDQVKRTATGQIFYLSEKAKNSGDPFQALREIPRLISSDALRTVKMEDGSTPLILINGMSVNSGIAPIDPKDIESVEIMDVVSARYLRTGKKHILNIKLKEKRAPFSYFETATRHDIPLRNGMGVVYFEVGNAKYSLYGRGAADYTYHDDAEYTDFQKSDNYLKQSSGSSQKDGHNVLGELLFKWWIAPKDYMAFHVYTSKNYSKQQTEGAGVYETSYTDAFDYAARNSDKSNLLTASLYHRHNFSDKQLLETTLAYNKNWNKNNGERTESYEDWLYQNLFRYDNRREDISLNSDYSWNIDTYNSLNIGAEIRYLNDHIDMLTDNYPMFRHKEWSGYIYSSYSGKVGPVLYMLSLGAEGIWLKAGDSNSQYYKPRGAASITYNLNDNNSFRFDYTLTNEAPAVGQLNPYNTSTDSLVHSVGNPDLKPLQKHNFSTAYTLNIGGFYIEPSLNYTLNTDMVEPFGYTDNGIYISTFRNSGRSQRLSVGGSVICRLGNWGTAYASAFHNLDYFEGQDARKSFSGGGGLTASYKKRTFIGDVNYINYEHTPVSRIHYKYPAYSSVQVNYKFTPNFYIAAALQYLHGKQPSETFTFSDGYQSLSTRTALDCSLRPWILIRYTFRKNNNKKIKLGKVVNSREDVIKLK